MKNGVDGSDKKTHWRCREKTTSKLFGNESWSWKLEPVSWIGIGLGCKLCAKENITRRWNTVVRVMVASLDI